MASQGLQVTTTEVDCHVKVKSQKFIESALCEHNNIQEGIGDCDTYIQTHI